ncbi:MAG: hypothetical protein ACJAVU_000898 [Cognaticolwellia sp.]|jgi:hypothetical protein
MNKLTLFTELVSLFEENNFSVDGQTISVDVVETNSLDIKSVLEGLGYDFNDLKTYRNGVLKLRIAAEAWEDIDCPFYLNWNDLYEQVALSTQLPKYFYIIEDKTSSLNVEQANIKKLKLFCHARQLLAQMSDLCEPKSGQNKGKDKLLFIIETESNVSRREFTPNVGWNELLLITDIDDALISVNKLIDALNLGDRQDTERRSVMRSALNELVNTCSDSVSIFPSIVRSIPELQKKYDEHHELFIKRFSVNKVLLEISQQDLQYTSKLNEIISNVQTKALTIPAGLVFIGAIMRIDYYLDGLAISIGIIMTTWIIYRSLDVYQDSFIHIENQVKAEFKRYDTLSEEAEVRTQSKKTKGELLGLIVKAKDNTKLIKNCVRFSLIAALLYIYQSTPVMPMEEINYIKSLFGFIK